MSDKVIEVLKYPVLVFSLLLALIAARYLLGLEFGVVTEVGTGGVKFAEKSQATYEALTSLESKVNQALVELEQLKKTTSQPPSTPEAQARVAEAAQTVSDQTAKVAQIQLPDRGRTDKLRGYIWIGDFDGNWSRVKLASPNTGQAIAAAPAQLQRGTEYTVLGNMVIRDGMPTNDDSYFRGRGSLGVLPAGTRVRLVSPPTGIKRSFATQFWAEVEAVREQARRAD
jgi:hypothetical protein